MQYSKEPNLSEEEKVQRDIYENKLLPLADEMYAFAFKLTRDPAKAENLVRVTYQDAWRFISLYTGDNSTRLTLRGRVKEQRRAGRGNTNAKAWLFSICRIAFVKGYGTRKKRLYKYKREYPIGEGYKITGTENLVQESETSAKTYAQLSLIGKFSGSIPLGNTSFSIDEILNDDYQLLQYSREGIPSEQLEMMLGGSPFSLEEWAGFIHLDQKRLQELLAGKESAPEILAERILKILSITRKGESIFGTQHEFYIWLKKDAPALGNIQPISLLDNSFGTNIVQDELTRIEHGVLA